jgi:hypothetical protein
VDFSHEQSIPASVLVNCTKSALISDWLLAIKLDLKMVKATKYGNCVDLQPDVPSLSWSRIPMRSGSGCANLRLAVRVLTDARGARSA